MHFSRCSVDRHDAALAGAEHLSRGRLLLRRVVVDSTSVLGTHVPALRFTVEFFATVK